MIGLIGQLSIMVDSGNEDIIRRNIEGYDNKLDSVYLVINDSTEGKFAPDLLVVIPDTIETVTCEDGYGLCYDVMLYEFDEVKVVGGAKLTNIDSMLSVLQCNRINMSEFKATEVTSASDLFRLSNIKNLDLEWMEEYRLEKVDAMFESLTTKVIQLDHLNTLRVTNMDNMFNGVNAIINGMMITKNVLSMQDMFTDIADINGYDLDLSWMNVNKVENMDNMFQGCKLRSICLEGWNVANVKTAKNMFKYASCEIKSLNKLNFEKAKDLCGMFYSYWAKDAVLEFGCTLSNVEDCSSMFSACSIKELNLEKVRLKDSILSSCTMILWQSRIGKLTIPENREGLCDLEGEAKDLINKDAEIIIIPDERIYKHEQH